MRCFISLWWKLVGLFVRLFVRLFGRLFARLFVRLVARLFVRLVVRLFVRLFVRPFVRLFVWPPRGRCMQLLAVPKGVDTVPDLVLRFQNWVRTSLWVQPESYPMVHNVTLGTVSAAKRTQRNLR